MREMTDVSGETQGEDQINEVIKTDLSNML